MDNVSEFLYLAFATSLFCLGIYVFFQGYNELNIIVDKISISYNEKSVIYLQEEESVIGLQEEKYYSKGYVMTLLFEPLDYDIIVDKYLISKDYHDKSKISGYKLSKEYYKKEYIYDSEGNISKIKFTG